MTVGLPWPRGAVADDRLFRLVGPDGGSQTLQTRVLDRWPDGSVRWCLFDFFATWDGKGESGYRVEVGRPTNAPAPPFRSDPPAELLGLIVDDAEHNCGENITLGEGLESGPVRRRSALGLPTFPGLEFQGYADLFAGIPCVRVKLTIRNPRPADHPGGNWDLGADGSKLFAEVAVRVGLPDATPRLSTERGAGWTEFPSGSDVRQHSSGGGNWSSSNHVTRERRVTLREAGYAVRNPDHTRTTNGKRATPIVIAESPAGFRGVTMAQFWENFPKSVRTDSNGILLGLFPTQHEPHELQGGEQKTHTFSVAFGRDTITDEPMVWCRSPIVCRADPEWYAASGAVAYLTPKAGDPHAAYLALVDHAIDGPDTFLDKREKIDEYGWRHFGDLYGDHEAVYHKVTKDADPVSGASRGSAAPMISHYNNQYDCVAAFLVQFFRSGDVRWLSQGLECADHTCDIDVYHTDGDKAAYNRGLFWHTYHYADADTGTHRSYPKALTRGPVESLTQKMDELGETAEQLKKSYAVGGGPAASHNYNAGLMLAYFLTGNPLYRDTAVDLADFVIDMEDPTRTPFRFLSREFTGLASESGGGGYHGPGRAAGNSVLALLVGHQLSGDAKYLAKAEQLIRRVVHPKQNLDRLDLLNAELRWFYTMTLQALGRYLDYKIDLGQLDRMYGYARLTLLHYARWMAANERPILDRPERLQYPTETWASQDMRKVEVFQYAAKHATGEERALFLERAAWFFDYVPRKLNEFETKSLTRPVILMMKYGWSRNWWRQNPDAVAPPPAVPVTADEFGAWRMFVPQKAKAIKRAKVIVALGGIAAVAGLAAAVWWLLR